MVWETQEIKKAQNQILKNEPLQEAKANFLDATKLDQAQKSEILIKTDKFINDNKYETYGDSIKLLLKSLLTNPMNTDKDKISEHFFGLIGKEIQYAIEDWEDVNKSLKDAATEKYINNQINKEIVKDNEAQLKSDLESWKFQSDLQDNLSKVDAKYKVKEFKVWDKIYKESEFAKKTTINNPLLTKEEKDEAEKDFWAVQAFKLKLWIDETNPIISPEQQKNIENYTEFRRVSKNILLEAIANNWITAENVKKVESYNAINTSLWIANYNLDLNWLPVFQTEKSSDSDTFKPKEWGNSLTEISKDPINAMKSLDMDDSFDKMVDGKAQQVDIKTIKLDTNQKKDILKKLWNDENYQALSAKMVDWLIKQNENFFMPWLEWAAKENQIQVIKKCFNKDASINDDELAKSWLGEKQKEWLKQISNKVIDTYATNDAYVIQTAKEKFKVQKAVACCMQSFIWDFGGQTNIFNEQKSTESVKNFADNFSVKEWWFKFDSDNDTVTIDGTAQWGADIKFVYNMKTWEVKSSKYIRFDASSCHIGIKDIDKTTDINGMRELKSKWPILADVQKTISDKIDSKELNYGDINQKEAGAYFNKEFSNISIYHDNALAREQIDDAVGENIAMEKAIDTIKNIIPFKEQYWLSNADKNMSKIPQTMEIFSNSVFVLILTYIS